MTPKFSAFPFERLPRATRDQAMRESMVARWIAARGSAGRLGTLLGGTPRVAVVSPTVSFDPYAAVCTVRVGGASVEVRGASLAIRKIAQRLMSGVEELAAPRPLGLVEESIWSLVVATALEDLGLAGAVWPRSPEARSHASSSRPEPLEIVELVLTTGDLSLAIQIALPDSLPLRVPPAQPAPPWASRHVLDVPVVLGRCAISRATLDRLALRNLVTLDRPSGHANLDLEILGGVVGISAAPNAVVAEVVTGYLPRDMSLPDDAHVELSVALGTTQLSLRQVFELSIGQVVPLGRPLAGPFEVRAAGRVVGRGELVDVDGELAVRIVSLDQT